MTLIIIIYIYIILFFILGSMPNREQLKKIRKKLDLLLLRRMGIRVDKKIKLRKNPAR